ncbi:MAG: trifunctional transcriptional regulator/proline dehydrogenase/L-glutamate gamma-semialdehyde dehydrogenase [Plesiomonas sp.]
MASTTMGVKVDDATRERIKSAAQQIDRTPHWLIKQAIFAYLEQVERGVSLPTLLSAGDDAVEDTATPITATSAAYTPFLNFAEQIQPQSVSRAAITAAYRRAETDLLPMLIDRARQMPEQQAATHQMAHQLASALRQQKTARGRAGIVQSLLQEFSLSSQEGVALMCLAEPLLRIPDKATRDALIRDKISTGDWHSHVGNSPSVFVNAATWGLLFTGKLTATHNERYLSTALTRVIGKSGEPLIRKGVDMAMRLMGEQFVTGETIAQALANAAKREAQGFRYSYDMLGEAALTAADAARYFTSYQQAIHAIGKASNGRGIYSGPGISIKLSALHPRYSRAQYARVMEELYPRLLSLTLLARSYDIGLNIDAEESDRLEISLDLLEKLCFERGLEGWNGIGFVIQAYQKRCPYVIAHVIQLAQRSHHRLMIRLVKGAYWDSEIKRAQVDGLEDYPVYTRKVYTDIAYLACARQLLAAPEAIYPQFATHNAQTLSAIYHMAGNNYYPGQYEFQCLHGMGEPLYEQVTGSVAEGKYDRPCRIYAPVGTHETLLAYLVRRLLENGANTSFVNRIADASLAIDDLVADPLLTAEQLAQQEGQLGLSHPRIPLPRDLYGERRQNAVGFDLANEQRLASLSSALLSQSTEVINTGPMVEGWAFNTDPSVIKPVCNPAQPADIVGYIADSDEACIAQAFTQSALGFAIWSATPASARAACLESAAQMMEQQMQQLIGLLVREAGKTFSNAIAEVREAVDFLRYYAAQISTDFSNETHRPLGPVVCISPWNFPLAIFTGQVAAALAAGNSVLAKPAEQTPLIAARAVQLLHDAGVPLAVLQLLPGDGEAVGARLVADPQVRGVMFTGSTAVARLIQQTLAGRLDPQGHPIPLIAETGGLNCMIVDSSALTEQVVVDVISSAFDSAGQRCSALRLLCLQDDIADHTLQMLRGAMAEYRLGNPDRLCTDIGPVIDVQAKAGIDQHIQQMQDRGFRVYQTPVSVSVGDTEHSAIQMSVQTTEQTTVQTVNQSGTFVAPTLIELDQIADLQHEIFGPVLHVVRYARDALPQVIAQINASGYGLTLGVHTRIDETINQITASACVGNQYINRNMVGAVVGVQPFGGEGLSGTGPKAGGPLYLYRLLARYPAQALAQSLPSPEVIFSDTPAEHALDALRTWAEAEHQPALVALCTEYRSLAQGRTERVLRGPTGERNLYRLLPRARVWCISDTEQDALTQLAAALSVGCRVLWESVAHLSDLYVRLPAEVCARIDRCGAGLANEQHLEAVLHHGDADHVSLLSRQLAERTGALIMLESYPRGETELRLERLLHERALSINTAAAGGNASLMTIG